jgi:hypothetical protein
MTSLMKIKTNLHFLAKLTCHRGHVTYERIPGHRLVGFEEHTVRIAFGFLKIVEIKYFLTLLDTRCR